MKRFIRVVLYTVAAAALMLPAGCRKTTNDITPQPSAGSADTLAATLTRPQVLNVYPALINNGSGPGRVYINAMQVGNVPVSIPLLFDTGSAGVTLNALSIFPSTIADQNGFKFKSGRDTLQYQGITITKINVQKIYGSDSGIETRQLGNIGYAKIAVGDASGSVKMLTMPVLFFYQVLANGVPSTSGLGSIFGVNTTSNGAQGIADSTYMFRLVSPLKYLVYSNNLTAGYKLDAITLNGCAINTPGSCPAQGLLTVGLTTADAGNYQLNQLTALTDQSGLSAPQGFPAYPALPLYNPSILEATVGTAYRTRKVSVLLDSGNPGVVLNVARDSIRADNYPLIRLTTPSDNTYTYNQNTANFTTRFSPGSTRSVFGVYFFTQFNFMEDYQKGIIGLRVK